MQFFDCITPYNFPISDEPRPPKLWDITMLVYSFIKAFTRQVLRRSVPSTKVLNCYPNISQQNVGHYEENSFERI